MDVGIVLLASLAVLGFAYVVYSVVHLIHELEANNEKLAQKVSELSRENDAITADSGRLAMIIAEACERLVTEERPIEANEKNEEVLPVLARHTKLELENTQELLKKFAEGFCSILNELDVQHDHNIEWDNWLIDRAIGDGYRRISELLESNAKLKNGLTSAQRTIEIEHQQVEALERAHDKLEKEIASLRYVIASKDRELVQLTHLETLAKQGEIYYKKYRHLHKTFQKAAKQLLQYCDEKSETEATMVWQQLDT